MRAHHDVNDRPLPVESTNSNAQTIFKRRSEVDARRSKQGALRK